MPILVFAFTGVTTMDTPPIVSVRSRLVDALDPERHLLRMPLEPIWVHYCRSYMMPYPARVTKDGEYDLVGNVNEFFAVADEVMLNADQYQGIIDFTVEAVIVPMMSGEEKDVFVLSRFRPLFKFMRGKQQPVDKVKAVTLFIMLAWNDGRHFLYPTRRSSPITERLQFELRRLAQNGLIWTRLVRLIFMGASNLAGLVGAKEEIEQYSSVEEHETPDMIFSEVMGRTRKRPFSLEMQPVLRFGHVYEALGRQLIEQFMPEFAVVETGTGISNSDPLRNQSADGLLITQKKMKGRSFPADFPTVESDGELFDKQPTLSYVDNYDFHYMHFPAEAIFSIVEIKTSAKKWHAYEQCPLVYMPQVMQAMDVQGADKALFISIKYFVNMPIGKRDVEFTMEWIHNDLSVQRKLQNVYRAFSDCVLTQAPKLSPMFWDAHGKLYTSRQLLDGTSAQTHAVFSGIRREHAKIFHPFSGRYEEACKLLLPLKMAVGETNAAEWAAIDSEPANVTMNQTLVKMAEEFRRQLYSKNKRK